MKYNSEFKLGQIVWTVDAIAVETRVDDTGSWVSLLHFEVGSLLVSAVRFDAGCTSLGSLRAGHDYWVNEQQAFATKDEAQAECDRRNEE